MSEKKYLASVIEVGSIKTDTISLIKSPCGTGKTSFVFDMLVPTLGEKEKIVYLIDTACGRDQIANNREAAVAYSNMWEPYFNGEEILFGEEKFSAKVVVMCYAKFGWLSAQGMKFENVKYIVCDEFHHLVEYQTFDDEDDENDRNTCALAEEKLLKLCGNSDIKIIALSATPDYAMKKLAEYVTVIFDENSEGAEDLVKVETMEIIEYNNLDFMVSELTNEKGKGIIYTARITRIKKITDKLVSNGIVTSSFWSLSNEDHPMTDEQLTTREHVIVNEELPDDLDVLAINASSETSINIYGEIDYMVIHSQKEDTRTQVRGRYRKDLKRLYIYNAGYEYRVPEQYLDRWLSTKERNELCGILNQRNGKYYLYKWTTIKKQLWKKGYFISQTRKKNKRLYKIILE